MYKILIVLFSIIILYIPGCNTTTEPNVEEINTENTYLAIVPVNPDDPDDGASLGTITLIDDNGNLIDTGVKDILLESGESLSQKLQELADNAKNKGGFFSQLMKLLRELINSGLISSEDAMQVLKILIRADIP